MFERGKSMKKTIIIIGAGIAGLSAGCYAQMHGYETTIFEMHDKPGGLCTSWNRKEYIFDGCIHYLMGTNVASGYHKIWDELGALEGQKFINHSEFLRVNGAGGKELILYSDLKKLEKHLKELAPEDTDLLSDFIKTVRKLAKFNPSIDKAPEIRRKPEKLWLNFKALPLLYSLRKYGNMTIGDFTKHIQNPFLHETFPLLFFELNDFPIIALMGFIGNFSTGNCGYPVGGSLSFAQSIEKRYLELGGKIKYRTKVEKIQVENNSVKGILSSDGSIYLSDRVISAADGYGTIYNLLEGKYISDEINNRYQKLPVYPPCLYVTLGVNADLSAFPHGIYYKLQKPLEIAEEMQNWIGIQHYCFDPTLAPNQKSVVNVMILTKYDYWKILYKDKSAYQAEKKRISDVILTEFIKYYGIDKNLIEVVDVATPVTYERYTGTWQGSFMGWKPSINTPRTLKEKILPGITGLYMAGQWIEYTGGVPTAAKSGRDVVQIICREDKTNWKTIKKSEDH